MSRLRSIYVRRDRIAGALWGTLIGNALGRSMDESRPSIEAIDLNGPDITTPSPLRQSWSIEGAQALCLLMALQFPEEFSPDRLLRRTIEWSSMGLCYPDAESLIDDTDVRSLVREMEGRTPGFSRAAYRKALIRGSLVRMVPAVLCAQGTSEVGLVNLVQTLMPESADVTTLAASAMYALWLAAELQEVDYPWDHAKEQLRSLGPKIGIATDAVEVTFVADAFSEDGSSAPSPAWTLHGAHDALNSAESYAEAVGNTMSADASRAVLGAVAGGIAGIRFGMYGIPAVWRDTLRGRHQIDHALSKLFTTLAPLSEQPIGMVRTSLSHPLQIGTIGLKGGGRIGITFCPGKKQPVSMTGTWDRDLAVDLEAIQKWGATHLVSLLAPWEFEELGVMELGQMALRKGLIWHHAPIVDGHAPNILPTGYTSREWFEGRWPTISQELLTALRRGESVVVHCKGGLGRAGTAAALLLAASEPALTAEGVIERVREARPNAIETVTQEHYLAEVIGAARFRSR